MQTMHLSLEPMVNKSVSIVCFALLPAALHFAPDPQPFASKQSSAEVLVRIRL